MVSIEAITDRHNYVLLAQDLYWIRENRVEIKEKSDKYQGKWLPWFCRDPVTLFMNNLAFFLHYWVNLHNNLPSPCLLLSKKKDYQGEGLSRTAELAASVNRTVNSLLLFAVNNGNSCAHVINFCLIFSYACGQSLIKCSNGCEAIHQRGLPCWSVGFGCCCPFWGWPLNTISFHS